MSLNYLNEGKRYYRCRYPNIDEDLILEKQSLEEYNEFLKNKVKELETEIELLKIKTKDDEF
jgi:hypothetical protein